MCQGAYATTPYWIDQSELHIYSVEELCYYIKENVVLLEQSFMKMELATWIEEECKLKELGESLAVCIRQKSEFTIFIQRLLQYVHYYTEDEIAAIIQQLRENAEMSSLEKKKTRIDFYYKNGKYMVALRAYEGLRKELGTSDHVLLAKISYNIGTIYAHLYHFDMAAENYLTAYETDMLEDYFFAYLAAKRMVLSDQQYIDFVAQQIQQYEISLHLEKTIENLNNLWKESEEKQMLDELEESRNGQYMSEYYENVEQLSNRLKEAYRENVL